MTARPRTLAQLGSVSRGRSRHRPRDAEFLYGGPYPFVQTGDVKRAALNLTEFSQTYSEAGLAQSKLWNKGTLCITIAANIAETAILGMDACFPDSVIGFIADEDECDVRYVKYWFDVYKMRFQKVSKGAAQDNLSQTKLLSFTLDLPPVDQQREVADTLSLFDLHIENNQRRIALLDELLVDVFREWFCSSSFFPDMSFVRY